MAFRILNLLFLLATVIATPGCATEASLIKRASFDLDCPESKITVQRLDSRTSGVRGCGQRAVYVESCVSPRPCTWIQNTQPRR
jgi:hypothetical protein